MTLKKIGVLTLISLIMLPIFMTAALPAAPAQQNNAEKIRAEKLLWIADAAKRKVETLINITLANETVLEMINSTGLEEAFKGNITLFNEGVELLENATNYFEAGDYEKAAINVMQALKIFRDVFRYINRILCQSNVKKGEIIDARGLLEAMNRALLRIKKIRELMNCSQIENETITQTLNEAEQLLNITEAINMLQQGNVTGVAHNLVEANHLIAQATWMLKDELRRKLTERIEHFKAKMVQRLEKIREKLKEKGISEKTLLKHWNFTSIDEFRGNLTRIIDQIRNRIRMKGWDIMSIVGDLKYIGRQMRSLSFEFERRIREHEGAASVNLTINIVKMVRWQHRVMLVIKVENRGNVTLVFPNSAYGITIEKRVGGGWRLYYSPLSLQVLTTLKPGEFKVLKIGFNVAGHGVYRVVIHAKCMEETGWVEKHVDFVV